MFKSLDTVSIEYFYQFLEQRDAGKNKRIKVLWGGIYVTGLFLLFGSLFVSNSHPQTVYSYYCNWVYIVLFAVQVIMCFVISIPGVAGKHQKFYWTLFLYTYICLQIGAINVCVAGMGLETLPYGFFLIMICIVIGVILLNYVVVKRVIKRIPQGYFKKNGTRIFDDKNGKIRRSGVIVSLIISSLTLPLFISLYLIPRFVHFSNVFILVFVSFSSIIILLAMSVVNYFPILHIYCVNRFPTSEFTAAKMKKTK